MIRLPFLTLALLALTAGTITTTAPAAESEASKTGAAAELAKAADYMARRVLEGHIDFDADEIQAATGVDVETIEEQVLQRAVLDRLAELREELPDPDATQTAAGGDLVALHSFDQFVETFDAYENVPRMVLLLSPT